MEFSIQFEREDTRLKDLVYRRYGGSAEDIFSMPFFDGCELIRYALGAECEDRLFFRWSLGYQSQMSFEEFKREIGSADDNWEDNRSAEEILKKVKGILG